MARLGYAIIAVSDMTRSVAFYRELLGFQTHYESPDWTEFDTGATTLALHIAGTAAVPPPDHHAAGSAWISFAVDDVHRFHHDAVQRGVRCVQEPRDEAWGTNASYADPDGFVFSVARVNQA